MNVSMNWLNKYVQPSLPVEELAEKLTRIGIPVEEIEIPDVRLEKVIAVEVRSLEKHPNADKLSIAKIWDGAAEHQVVTGAQNVKVGQKLFWAPPGTELPTGQKIENGILREVASAGMLCSASELNLDSKLESEESKGGLLIAASETKPGENYLVSMGIDSPLLKFELTANRADCFSMIGIASEVSVLTSETLHLPEIVAEEKSTSETQNEVTIEVGNGELCPRFVALTLTDVQVAPSPLWLVKALQSIGLRSINNVVDVTNYVMMEMGQPLHAYDRDTLSENKLIARSAKEGEKIVTLDEKERILTSNMLVIADANGPVGIAGVMGGLHSEVTEKTKIIVLEGAVFNGPSIRKTSRALGLRSDASSRFERGVDQEKCHLAVLRAAQLLQEIGAGKISKGILDIEKNPKSREAISFSADRINCFLGTEIAEEKMISILKSLGCDVNKASENEWTATPPTWRSDMTIFEDLAEEIIRIYGFDKIPPTLPVSSSKVIQLPKLSKTERKATDIFAGFGFNQCVNFSFTSPEVAKKLNISIEKMIPVLNPIVDELSHMKTTLLGSLLETLQRNQSQKVRDLRLFEVARVFMADQLPLAGNLPTEYLMLSAVAAGPTGVNTWKASEKAADFYYMKGIAESAFSELGIEEISYKVGSNSSLHPGRTAEIFYKDISIGWIGEIHPEVQENFDLTQPTIYLEINLDLISEDALPIPQYQSFGRFPMISRDLAFVFPNGVTNEEITSTIEKSAASELLTSFSLFDVYQGDRLAEGMKSLAYSFTFQHKERTLEDKEVDEVIQRIIEEVVKTHQGEFRS